MKNFYSLESFDPVFIRWYKGILVGGILVSAIFLVRDIYCGNTLARIILDILTILADSIALYLGVRKKKYLAGIVVVFCYGIVALTWSAILGGGVKSPFMLYFMVMSLTSGMLFRGSLQWIIASVSLGSLLFVYLVELVWPELLGQIRSDFWDYALNYIAIYFLIFYGTYLAKNYLNTQKDKLKEKTLKIAAQNKTLFAQQEEINKLNTELQKQLDERTKQLSDALKEASGREAYMRSLVESQSTFLFRIDMAGKILFINNALAKLIQVQKKSNASEGFLQDRLLEKDALFLEKIVFEALDKPGSPIKATLPVKNHLENGGIESRYIDWEFLAVKNAKTNKMEIQAVGYDITHRLSIEEEMKKKSNQLEKLTRDLIRRNNELTDFGYMVSHNLRGPVANIVGLTELYPDSEEDEVIKRLRISSKRLDSIIKDLNLVVDLKNTSRTDFERVSLLEITNQVIFQLEEKIKSKKAEIHLDFPKEFEILLIRPYIFSIIYNLLSNGIKYASPERKPKVWVTVEDSDKGYAISVCDNGIGINMEKYGSRLFNLYERFNETEEGQGIGLHMVKVQVEAMNGHIEVNSVPGKGTCFKLTFPKNLPLFVHQALKL
ncbi:MAG: HAMP domain-containing histidine kinase [Bacteroidia bacterium]|nr:HAMP domain-containing histidine kinase [Bacteroidia bacterium]